MNLDEESINTGKLTPSRGFCSGLIADFSGSAPGVRDGSSTDVGLRSLDVCFRCESGRVRAENEDRYPGVRFQAQSGHEDRGRQLP